MVPEWNAEKCIQCNNCAFVCSHATIRPFCLTAAEAEAAPASTKLADTKPKASEYKFTMPCLLWTAWLRRVRHRLPDCPLSR